MTKLKVDEFLDNYLIDKINHGSSKEGLLELREKAIKLLAYSQRNMDPNEALSMIMSELKVASAMFLSDKNAFETNFITALSTCIYVPSTNGSYKLKVYGGVESRYYNSPQITEDTIFDGASISKLFTALLIFKFIDYGFLALDDKISDLDYSFAAMDDFTIRDVLMLHGKIVTPKTEPAITAAINQAEAEKILRTLYPISKDKTTNCYTDLGAIVMSRVMETVYERKTNDKLSFDKLMQKFIFEPLGLQNTKYNPNIITDSIAGNGNALGWVHDPKTRILGGVTGAAGVFVNNDDMIKLADGIFSANPNNYNYQTDLVSYDNVRQLGKITFPDSEQKQKGILGMYQKFPSAEADFLYKTFVPRLYADGAFAAQGWTGSVVVFDPINKLHNSILVSALGKQEEEKDNTRFKNDKPIGYLPRYKEYQRFITIQTLLIDMLKKYFDTYIEDNTIQKTLVLK